MKPKYSWLKQVQGKTCKYFTSYGFLTFSTEKAALKIAEGPRSLGYELYMVQHDKDGLHTVCYL